jgi:hypothetical protein
MSHLRDWRINIRNYRYSCGHRLRDVSLQSGNADHNMTPSDLCEQKSNAEENVRNKPKYEITALEKSSFHVMISPLTPNLPPIGDRAHCDASALPEREIFHNCPPQ